jgi:succinate dehydrogenase/fumarate reductase flavoprotein subunit
MATLESIRSWDFDVDVVVLGAGLAGCVAAIEAFDSRSDLNVLIAEKMPEARHGGASRCAGQYLYCPPSSAFDDLCAYQRALNEPLRIPEPVLRAWATAVTTNRAWIAGMADAVGMRLVHRFNRPPDFPAFPGAWCVEEVYSIGVEGESGVWQAFRRNVESRGIPVEYELRAVDLVQDGDTLEVFGVRAERDGRDISIKARRGVVVCVGSFAADLSMQREYAGYPAMYSMGCPANTGDGVKMLQKAGAELWHVRGPGQVGGIFPAVKVPDFSSAFFRDHIKSNSWIDIAADNRRFYDETADYESTHFKIFKHGRWVDSPLPYVLPVHMILDERTRRTSQLCLDWAGWNAIVEGYRWSRDNSVEVEKGWLTRAESIRALATLIGRDPDELDATVDRYNAACVAAVDSEFGRNAARMEPIREPPFYAMQLVPGIGQATAGGLRNERSQVMSQNGTPIPRLYEAGELGSTLANLYQNGSFLTEAIAFGRIAGRHVATEVPWAK